MNKARYAVILADPPWKYRAWKGDRGMRTAESFYKTMTAQALHALRPRIDEWAAKDCALFLWATPPAARSSWNTPWRKSSPLRNSRCQM